MQHRRLETLYIVEKAYTWSAVTINGIPCSQPDNSMPSMFIPVFDSYEKARQWIEDEEVSIREVKVIIYNTKDEAKEALRRIQENDYRKRLEAGKGKWHVEEETIEN